MALEHITSVKDLMERAHQAEADDELEHASELYEQVIKDDPTNEFGYDRLMIVYRKLKEYKKELRIINAGIKPFKNYYKSKSKHSKSKKVADLSNAFFLPIIVQHTIQTFLLIMSDFVQIFLLIFFLPENIHVSGANSSISPGWQLSSLQSAPSVEKRIALALPVFKTDRLAIVIPMRSESSVSDILRLAIITSIFTIMDIVK